MLRKSVLKFVNLGREAEFEGKRPDCPLRDPAPCRARERSLTCFAQRSKLFML